jgi:hypothetical protein
MGYMTKTPIKKSSMVYGKSQTLSMNLPSTAIVQGLLNMSWLKPLLVKHLITSLVVSLHSKAMLTIIKSILIIKTINLMTTSIRPITVVLLINNMLLINIVMPIMIITMSIMITDIAKVLRKFKTIDSKTLWTLTSSTLNNHKEKRNDNNI